MSERSFKHHLSPQELARRQRWVAVGVAVLAFLMVGTWLVTLPSRISGATPRTTWDAWWGKSPDATYIDTSEFEKMNEETNKTIEHTLEVIQKSQTTAAGASASSSVAASSSTSISTSTIKTLKQKIK